MKRFQSLFFWGLAILIPIAGFGQTGQSASKQLGLMLVQYDSIVKSGDLQARLRIVLAYRKFLHEAPNSILSTAHAYAAVGDSVNALLALHELADLGLSNDDLLSGKDQKFQHFSQSESYTRVLDDFRANKLPVTNGELYIDLTDEGFLPEDISFDPISGDFLITSVLEKKIIRLSDKGVVTLFASSPSQWPMFAVKVDSINKMVWATEVAADGFSPAPKKDWGHSALLCFDLRTGKLMKRFEGPTNSELGDLTLDEFGVPVVSDGKGGGIYRLTKDKLERIDKGDFISPQTLALTPDRKRLIVPDYVRGIAILDPADGQVEWIKNGKRAALSGVDGVYSFDHRLILTQNGTTPEQVIELKMNNISTTIISVKIIERGTLMLGDPTHGVQVGEWFYYIANSGWDNLTDNGDPKPGTKARPAHIMRYRLSKSE